MMNENLRLIVSGLSGEDAESTVIAVAEKC